MLADFELVEIDRLNKAIERERERLCSLVEMLGALGVCVWLDEAGGITIVNEALEAISFPYPIALGPGYTALGASGT